MTNESHKLQDQAAGGKEFRELILQDGTIVCVSVAVRQFKKAAIGRRYGYMQFKTKMKTTTKYICSVTANSKEESLKIGWDLLRGSNLAESNGWVWVKSKPSEPCQEHPKVNREQT